jgi:hypothetical protein
VGEELSSPPPPQPHSCGVGRRVVVGLDWEKEAKAFMYLMNKLVETYPRIVPNEEVNLVRKAYLDRDEWSFVIHSSAVALFFRYSKEYEEDPLVQELVSIAHRILLKYKSRIEENGGEC